MDGIIGYRSPSLYAPGEEIQVGLRAVSYTHLQSTGGSWIFVLDPDGKKAYRRSIKIGRQNPQYYEVLEGLEAGEKVIVSSYESYKDNDCLLYTSYRK